MKQRYKLYILSAIATLVMTMPVFGAICLDVKDTDWFANQLEEVLAEEVLSGRKYTYSLPDITKPEEKGANSMAYFDQVIAYMMTNNLESYTCEFPNQTWRELEAEGIYRTASNAFVRMKEKHHELGGFYESITKKMSTYNGGTTLTIIIKNLSQSNSEITNKKEMFFDRIDEIVEEMFVNGYISHSDSDYSKALYFYKWCAHNLQYDLSYQPSSYNGYGTLFNGTGVCQGYTAIFNALCNAAGIEAYGVGGTVRGGNHIWSYANLDGNWLHIDATFGDPIPNRDGYCDVSYFGLTLAQISQTHTIREFN